MASLHQKYPEPTSSQVKSVENPLVVLPLVLPPYTDPGSDGYHSLEAPSLWVSQTRSSYVSHPLTDWASDHQLWFGHKTDEVVQWTERNIMNQKLKKRLTEMERKKTAK